MTEGIFINKGEQPYARQHMTYGADYSTRRVKGNFHMGKPQTSFINVFKEAFTERFGTPTAWAGGQILGNFACLPGVADLRRGGNFRSGERFEVGDLRIDVATLTVIVEYDGDGASMSNLLKYWPYVQGELSIKPNLPIAVCAFSNWYSYGSYRDLWQWLFTRMDADQSNVVSLHGRQFDHGGQDVALRNASIQQALDWLSGLGVGDKELSNTASNDA